MLLKVGVAGASRRDSELRRVLLQVLLPAKTQSCEGSVAGCCCRPDSDLRRVLSQSLLRGLGAAAGRVLLHAGPDSVLWQGAVAGYCGRVLLQVRVAQGAVGGRAAGCRWAAQGCRCRPRLRVAQGRPIIAV